MVLGWGCVTSLKYEQSLTLLRQGFHPTTGVSRPPINITDGPEDRQQGEYRMQQHPLTGEMIRVWVPAAGSSGVEDDPDTDIDESVGETIRIPCQARAIITGGINVQGTAERWTSKGEYEDVDFIKIQVPPNYIITKRDRITDITDSRGNFIWLEEEYGRFTPTIFDVTGVSPSVDPFGSLVEFVVMARRADIQTLDGLEKRSVVVDNG